MQGKARVCVYGYVDVGVGNVAVVHFTHTNTVNTLNHAQFCCLLEYPLKNSKSSTLGEDYVISQRENESNGMLVVYFR